jgi:hypothetical protein
MSFLHPIQPVFAFGTDEQHYLYEFGTQNTESFKIYIMFNIHSVVAQGL